MENLIEKVKAGDPTAVEFFYKQYCTKINKYLSIKLPSIEDADDLTNEVFLEAIDSINYLKEKEKVESWLIRIAHNKMVDFYRKRKVKSILLSQIPYLQIVAREITEPEFQFEKNRIKEKIELTFFKLSSKHQLILRLHYEEKISVKELAKDFNLSFKATESLLFRARINFQLAYERD